MRVTVLHIALATNDPRNGQDTGRVRAIQPGLAIDLQWGDLGREPRYHIKDGYLWIHGDKFLITGQRDWVGNWCWRSVQMPIQEACRFLNSLSRNDRWHLEGGICDITDLYEKGKLTPAAFDFEPAEQRTRQ